MEAPTLKQLTNILNVIPQSSLSKFNIIRRKLYASLLLMLSDIITISLSLISSIYITHVFIGNSLHPMEYFKLIPIITSIFLVVFYFRGLYPGFGIDVIQELKTLTQGISIVFAFLALMTFLIDRTGEYSRFAFLLSWVIAILSVPLGRATIRKLFGNKSWWGIPVIIIGAGRAGEQVIKSLKKHPQIGLRAIVAVDDDVDKWGYIYQIPVIGGLEIIPELTRKLSVDHAIIAIPRVSKQRQQEIIKKYSKYFSNVTIIPELYGLNTLWVSTQDLGGILGLKVQQSLLQRTAKIQKRIFDIIFASLLIILSIPLYIIIAIAIKLDSKGSILFYQKRVGLNHKKFKMIKFRTMHVDAERRLYQILKENPDLYNEYKVYHKLKNDPRLTRIGKFLRKYSLDELPQFFNVLKGDMSLTGPRAYQIFEHEKVNSHEDIIFKVKPGISGLWQVTDRNQTSFEERKITDIYYIRNWSMFLDFYILARTIVVVLRGNGG